MLQSVGEPTIVSSPVVLGNRDYWSLLVPVVDREEGNFVSTQVGAVVWLDHFTQKQVSHSVIPALEVDP